MILPDKEYIEYNGENRARLILKGRWLYDSITHMTVQIFAINYDYYFEMDKVDGVLEKGQEPELNEQGELYMIAWHDVKYFSFAVTTEFGGLTLDKAKTAAENTIKQKIEWFDPITLDFN